MYGKGALLTGALLLLAGFNFGHPGDPLDRILVLYHHGDSLFRLSNNTPATDSIALTDFEAVIDLLGRQPQTQGIQGASPRDTLLFESYLKKGILLDSKYDYSGAKTAYCTALHFHPQNDSLTFVVHVYAGTAYYNLNNFDSSRYFLLDAETQVHRYKDREDEVRLYNTLGVLYFDNGNYEQGKNYFNRALDIVKAKRPLDTISAVNLQTNIATSFYHLGLFREALEIYHQVLAYHESDDLIYMNMGMAYTALEKYRDALDCFHKVDVKTVPGVLNEIGYALLHLQQPDSAARRLDELQTRAAALKINELDLGTNDLYRADLMAGAGNFIAAIQSVQKAIIIFSPNFSKEDMFANPANFTGTFASYRLFDALLKKAVLFERLYRVQPKEQYLVAANEAYKATLAILRYIEKSYDTDDAKLFLKKKNNAAYQGALSVCMELYRLHPEGNYLEQAFLISEKSKASVITANLEERSLNKIPGIEGGLLQKQQNIKYNIARLNVRLGETNGKEEMEKISQEKAGYEIELASLQKQLEQNGYYYRLKYEDATPGVSELQHHLDPQQALISCYLTRDALHVFFLTATAFTYARIDSVSSLQKDVDDWLTELKTTENGRKFRGGPIGNRLSRSLVTPIQAAVAGKQEWIIVPDGFLYFLPFESLPDSKGDGPLLETTTISYQFASRLIIPASGGSGGPGSSAGSGSSSSMDVLAFAPFTTKGAKVGEDGLEAFARLPASQDEITGLAGRQYIDSQATKERFLATLNQYPIVHLATHAVSSIQDASGSFIAFYPLHSHAIENNLFLEELYGLDMNRTKLVVISACETGQGELVSNEGVISLARAFAYAGCSASISSLWKADDEATSFILQRFYFYLRKGQTKSGALRQAKLDYLASGTVNKSPAYWSHLVLIGDPAPVYNAGNPYKWGILVFFSGLLIFALWRFLRAKISRLFFQAS